MSLISNKVSRAILPASALIGLLVIVAYMAGMFDEVVTAGTKPIPQAYQGEEYVVSESAVVHHEVVNANVTAKVNTLVASRLLAQLKSLNVRAGQSVSAGELLAEIDDADLQARASQVKAQQDALAVQLKQARKQLERSETLQSQGLVAVNVVDEWRAKVNELQAQHQALAQQLEGALVALSDTQILAPIDGTVVERLQEPGAMLTPGTPIVALYNPAQLQVTAAVREQQASHLQLSEKLKIHIPASGMTQYATVSEIVPVADSNARRFMVKLDIELANNVKPGMYAQLYLPEKPRMHVLIPRQLIKRYGQLTMVEVVEQRQLHKRFIRLGQVIDNQVEVLAGLEAGEILAVR
ncbi:efflux RND transporter periplasmic adaptor subunit [Pseudoalteromonas byunsanensis]|uniref:Efflux transporter periplasmic adaptor subunit n=1 Tax=Pseudoalteromonas byunsanensis TaxID=327939 RepID=A0A1S1N3W7_9GAMM|nr:efflux RND transporter periplasmic adaptor subunit [Pseudoalteromonas byunsanensis]OHU94672.1 efflux transporter periplasmic adaptor subunit [Pseudoalteromonas byunsanensis]